MDTHSAPVRAVAATTPNRNVMAIAWRRPGAASSSRERHLTYARTRRGLQVRPGEELQGVARRVLEVDAPAAVFGVRLAAALHLRGGPVFDIEVTGLLGIYTTHLHRPAT